MSEGRGYDGKVFWRHTVSDVVHMSGIGWIVKVDLVDWGVDGEYAHWKES